MKIYWWNIDWFVFFCNFESLNVIRLLNIFLVEFDFYFCCLNFCLYMVENGIKKVKSVCLRKNSFKLWCIYKKIFEKLYNFLKYIYVYLFLIILFVKNYNFR